MKRALGFILGAAGMAGYAYCISAAWLFRVGNREGTFALLLLCLPFTLLVLAAWRLSSQKMYAWAAAVGTSLVAIAVTFAIALH